MSDYEFTESQSDGVRAMARALTYIHETARELRAASEGYPDDARLAHMAASITADELLLEISINEIPGYPETVYGSIPGDGPTVCALCFQGRHDACTDVVHCHCKDHELAEINDGVSQSQAGAIQPMLNTIGCEVGVRLEGRGYQPCGKALPCAIAGHAQAGQRVTLGGRTIATVYPEPQSPNDPYDLGERRHQ